jgi:hypothetical protein
MTRSYESEEVCEEFATITYKLAENGCMQETESSVNKRIADTWGFRYACIELIDGIFSSPFEIGGMQFYAYKSVRFTVSGTAWSTSFDDITRIKTYDKKED